MILIEGVLLHWWWAVAATVGYALLATVARARMTRWFGPEWERVPPEVSVVAHLRRLRRERNAEAPDAAATPTHDAP